LSFRPWHRPFEDPRASKVRPLESAGLGGGRVPPEKTPWGLTLALLAGVLIPLGILVWMLWGGTGPVGRTAMCVGVAFVLVRGVVQARAARKRARDRAEARAATRAE